MKNHAFIFQVHKNPELLRRILSVLEADNHYFFINVDLKCNNYNDFKNIANDIKNIHFIDRINVHHGGISQINCTLALLNSVIDSSITFDFIHSLSGQDYPLRSNKQFDAFFEETEFSYMAFETDSYHEKCMKSKYPSRVNNWYFNNNYSTISKIYRYSGLFTLLNLIIKRKEIKKLWGGWSWFTFNSATTHYILDYLRQHPEYLKRFNHTFCGDELFFQTILKNNISELKINTQMPLRFVSWVPKRVIDNPYRPFTLNENEFEEIINSQAFFCRKVDYPESRKLLDLIDKQRGCTFNIDECSPVL